MHTSRLLLSVMTPVAVLGLTACGGDDKPKTPSAPVCSEQWKEGETLPKDYSGCKASESEGKEAASGQQCSAGGYLISYEDKLFAITGEKIQAGSRTSTEYAAALSKCKG